MSKTDLVNAVDFRIREELEKKFVEVYKAQKVAFGKTILEYDRIDLFCTEILGYTLKWFHKQMLRFQERNPFCLVLAPRGTGKSTICTVARAIYELRKNPNIRILIVSNTQSQASVYLREIKNHFEGNEEFILTYGEIKGEKWSDKEIDVKDRKSHEKEHNVTCVGVGGPVVGRHYDLILFDDLVDEENARTQLQRERLKIWFYKALLPTLMPVTGRAMGVGTRYYPNDLYGDLIKNNPDFKWAVWPAIIERNGEKESIWPEMLPLELLYNKKKSMGLALFNSQYMNSVDAMEGKIFNFEDFKFYKVLPEKVRIFQGVDLAIAENETACYFVICTIAKDEYNNVYILDVHRTKASFLKQTQLIEQKFHQFHPMRVYIEANAYQRAQVQNLLANTDVRVKPIITLKDKVTRAWHIAHRFESGQVYFPEYGMQDFMDELLSFPDGDYDDQFDAFEIAVSGSKKGRKKERREFGVL